MDYKIKIAFILGVSIIIASMLHGGLYSTVNHGKGAYSTVNNITGGKVYCYLGDCKKVSLK